METSFYWSIGIVRRDARAEKKHAPKVFDFCSVDNGEKRERERETKE